VRRILLLGKNGQLGWELQRSLAPLADLVALDRAETRAPGAGAGSADARPVLCGDLGRPEELEATVRVLAPDVIVNAAAYTAVDKAETDEEAARAINATAPGALARLCAELGAWMVHYSTDYVFDGTGTTPWRESDPTGPLSVYGKTKLDGEERIRASGCRHMILRTSWVYGARGVNFAKTILRLAAEREALRVIDDQVGAPTGADLLADVTAHALRGLEARPDLGGTYHVAAKGETSWFEYARFVIDTARARGWSLKVARNDVCPVPSSAYPLPARRPDNSRLNCERFESAFSLRLPSWQYGVERLLAELSPA
jgi:dTDP-4-dehydrorhamnose reductase